MENNHEKQLQKFKDLVEDVKVCMMITKAENGKLTARPMSNAKVEEDGSVWFFTNDYSGKVDQISEENEIFLTYASPSANSYVSFNASATLSDDKEKIDELWTPAMNAWFKDGKDDPKILLIHATPIEAEYWDGSSSKIVMLFHMVKAAITGNFTGGDHAKLKI
ncbi:MAG: pyridoxamine 5'-phosphate oxidase family protein [Ferruginibacter sp.]|nr:pyridoxamine 5'-phosphate oxidase family protein [Ferruginibacter sp.]